MIHRKGTTVYNKGKKIKTFEDEEDAESFANALSMMENNKTNKVVEQKTNKLFTSINESLHSASINAEIKQLMNKYKLPIASMMLIASLNNLRITEIENIEYLENVIKTDIENIENMLNNKLNSKLNKLMKKYKLSITHMMLIASLDQLTTNEIFDIGFIKDRIETHSEYIDFHTPGTKYNNKNILDEKKTINKLFTSINEFKQHLLSEGKEFEYMLLSRLQSDCKYFLGNGNGSERNLWAGNVDDQIEKMKELYNSVDPKPEWISMEDIEDFEIKMNDKLEEVQSENI